MIELINLHKSFGAINALSDINLFIQEGEIFGIIGKSGAGKSTLLRTINLLERPDNGEVIVNHQALMNLQPAALRDARHKIGMIFQHFNLLNTQTVYDNIALPMRIQDSAEADIAEKVAELLALVELTEKQHAYPADLSGGQKQRVAIARALSTSPNILLCDEATSSLDPNTTEAILQLLQRINQRYGLTIVLITHEMDVVKRICHRLAVMMGGKLIESMPLADVFTYPNSEASRLLSAQITPALPAYLKESMTQSPTDRPLLRLLFQGDVATVPFITQTSRTLGIDITILLANIDHFDTLTCGVLIVQLIDASTYILDDFMTKANEAGLTVEILGYVIAPNAL